MVSAIIFDFDGTIIDTEWSQFATVQHEFRNHGHDYDIESFRAMAGRADGPHWADVLQDLIGPRADIEAIRSRRLKAHHDLIAETEIRPGVVELMAQAELRDRPLAVASSSPSSWVERHLSDRGLIDRFQFIATRDLVDRAKPWPDVFLAAAEGIQVDPSRCLVIEDSHNGVAAAKAAGMMCVAVPNPVTATTDLSAADLVLESLAELPYERFDLH
ncbi:MAG: HAD family hydrolase [Acidimicrobiales bacterium]